MVRKHKAEDAKKVQTEDARALDAFQNLMARIGFGSGNLMEGTEYPLTRLTKNYQLLTSLYRSHWIIRKIIDLIPEDMVKNWITLTSQVTPEMIDDLNKVVRKTKTKANVLKALKWGRLYGGAAAVMMIKGHEDILDQPLNLDLVMPDSFKGLLVLDRWSGINPTSETISDINSPDFDLPEYYQITIAGEGGRTINVHSSRVLRFTGRDLPYFERWAEQNWGTSEVEIVFDELKKRDNTSWNIASLIFLANIRVLKMDKLASALAVNNPQAQTALYNTLSAQNQLMSNMGMMILNKDDEFDSKQYSFTGMAEIYESFMLDMCGATGYPMTKLFGRSPAGMSATGESDLQNYDSLIESQQETYLQPNLDKLLPVICMSVWGMVPDDLDYKFNPVRSITTDKLAEINSKFIEGITKVFDSGILGRKTVLKELRQLSEVTGVFTNITDEMIEKADDEIQTAMDLPMFGEGEEVGKPEDKPEPQDE